MARQIWIIIVPAINFERECKQQTKIKSNKKKKKEKNFLILIKLEIVNAQSAAGFCIFSMELVISVQ